MGQRLVPLLTSPSLSSHFQEKRIYDLKKKNQELEKFKFVLDYKIKELKKQIEPRENEIKVMKEQIQEVRAGAHTPHPSDLCPLQPYCSLPASQSKLDGNVAWVPWAVVVGAQGGA